MWSCSNDSRAIATTAMLVCSVGIISALGGCGAELRPTPTNASISVDTTTRFQTITGWEVEAQAGQEEARGYPQYRDALLDRAVNDLGVTRVRLWLRSGFENPVDVWAEQRAGRRPPSRCGRYTTVNDNDDPNTINPAGFHFSQLDYTIEQLVLPLKRRVEARGEKFFVNANYVAFMKQCARGARYDHTTPAEYAEFVLASYLHLRDKYRLVPDAWEVILEPENTWFWHGKEIGEAIVAAGRLLEQHGFTARFIAPSTTKAGNAPRYIDELMQVPGVRPYLAEFAYHRYRGFSNRDFVAIAERGARYHVNTSMLEHIGSGYQDLQQDLKVANVSAWQQFALAYPSPDDNGAQYYIIEKPNSRQPVIRMGERTRYLRQYFRYVRPGAVRVAAGSDNSAVDPVAFSGPRHQQVVVLKCDRAARIAISGLPAGKYYARYTTADATDVAAKLRGTAKGIDVMMPAAGVLTVFSER